MGYMAILDAIRRFIGADPAPAPSAPKPSWLAPVPFLRNVVRYEPHRDAWRQYETDAPTPERMLSLLRSLDQGDVYRLADAAQEIESKDLQIYGLLQTRRNAITALDWTIEPPDEDDIPAGMEAAAEEAAQFCREALQRIPTWDTTLEHLATAHGPGVAVTELVWNRGGLVGTEDLAGHRLFIDPARSNRLRMDSDADMINGLPLAPDHKWIIFTPDSRAGYPFRVTLTRVMIYTWVIKHFAIADWSSFLEKFGHPVRIAKTGDPNAMLADTNVRNQLAEALKDMSSEFYAILPSGVEMEYIETGKGTEPYTSMVAYLDSKLSIAVLGQTLTTEQGERGARSLGEVHDKVRGDILKSDLKREARCIRERVLTPMVRFKWPDKDVPVPYFVRELEQRRDLESERLDMSQLDMGLNRGLVVDPEVIYERLHLPIPAGGPKIVAPEPEEKPGDDPKSKPKP